MSAETAGEGLLSLEAYVGLWIEHALDLAVHEGRVLSFGLAGELGTGHRRIRVELDAHGRVRAAEPG